MSNRNITRKLWESNPACHWCGRTTVFNANPTQGEPSPPHMATLDHLRSRLHPERGRPTPTRQTVIACYECNHSRGADEVSAMERGELRRRSRYRAAPYAARKTNNRYAIHRVSDGARISEFANKGIIFAMVGCLNRGKSLSDMQRSILLSQEM